MSAKDKITVKSRTSIFVKVMVCFLLIILTPTVVMGVVWYRDIREKNQTAVMEKEHRSLMETQKTYNQIIMSVEQSLLDILYGASYQNYMATKKPEHMVQVIKEVSRITNWSPSLYSVYLYEIDTGKIWDSTSKQQSLESFYDTLWLEQRELSTSVQHLPIRKNMDEITASYYPVKNVLTVITLQAMNAVLVGNVDMEALGRELSEQFGFRGKRICLFKAEEVLYDSLSSGKDLAEAGNLDWNAQDGFYAARGEEEYYFACALSEEVYYMESIPLDMLYSDSIGYGSYVMRVTGIVLVVMVVLAFLMTARVYNPLDELYSVVSVNQKNSGQTGPDEEAGGQAIKKAFFHMKNVRKTEADARIMEAFVSAAKLRMLFDGIITQEHFFQETAAIFGLSERKQCSLLLCRLRENLAKGEREERNRRLQETLDVYLVVRLEGILAETSTGDFAVLFSGSTEKEIHRAERFLIKIFNELTGDSNYFASSKAFSREESVEEQYRICRLSLENVAFFERQSSDNEPVYPLLEENYSYKSMLNYAPAIIRAIITGEVQDLTEKLAELQNEILAAGRKDYAQNLCARILGEIDKELVLEPPENGRDLLREVYEIQTLNRLMEYMEEILKKRLELLNNQESHQKENKYYQDAIAYIQENYSRNINVTEVADAIGISYVYLNKIFKAHHERDEKLIDYLNMIRIGKAAELLLETDETLAVIAEKVGYNNVQSFTRFFKKYKGLTPGEWKRKHRGAS